MLILNIGLQTASGGRLSPRNVHATLIGRCGYALHCGTYNSATEPTAVYVVPGLTGPQVYRLAEALHQDCIALYAPLTKRGQLIGPRADAWGAFDPLQFFMPDGIRLAHSYHAIPASVQA